GTLISCTAGTNYPLNGAGNENRLSLYRQDQQLVGEIPHVIQASQIINILRAGAQARVQPLAGHDITHLLLARGVLGVGEQAVGMGHGLSPLLRKLYDSACRAISASILSALQQTWCGVLSGSASALRRRRQSAAHRRVGARTNRR